MAKFTVCCSVPSSFRILLEISHEGVGHWVKLRILYFYFLVLAMNTENKCSMIMIISVFLVIGVEGCCDLYGICSLKKILMRLQHEVSELCLMRMITLISFFSLLHGTACFLGAFHENQEPLWFAIIHHPMLHLFFFCIVFHMINRLGMETDSLHESLHPKQVFSCVLYHFFFTQDLSLDQVL